MYRRSLHVSSMALALCGAIGLAHAADTDFITDKAVPRAARPQSAGPRLAKAEISKSEIGKPEIVKASVKAEDPKGGVSNDATGSLATKPSRAGQAKSDPKASADMEALVVSVQTGGLTNVDARDWAPEHAAPGPLPGTGQGKAAPEAEKTLDPEPDAPVVAPVTRESNDPLDHPKVGTAPTGAKNAASAGAATAPASGDAKKVDAQAAPSELPPLNLAIKAALDRRAAEDIKGPHASERRKEREAVAFFYAAHGFAPAWSEAGKPIAAVSPILARLARAGDDALTLGPVPKDLRTEGTPAQIAESDLALTEAVVDYARQATGSRVDPFAISRLIGARPQLADPAEVIDSLIAAGADAGDHLQALNPVDPRYVALRDKLGELRAARVATNVTPIPPGPTLKIGMRDPRVPLIRSRFSLGAGTEGEADDLRYDTVVAAAVADFQRANGLPASGALTKRTIAALSGGEPSQLEASIVANMEMWRWMPRELGRDHIEVNVPDYTVRVYHDGQVVSANRVVVGKTSTPTPIFSNTMKFLIVNPVWNVPESIIKKEFLPKAEGDPSYLAAHGYTVSYRNGQLVVKQPSGAKNALGRIKFMFPNDYSVYLHDTPSKGLFSASRRAFSHGCVRVDQPFAFAESVLNTSSDDGGPAKWSQKRLERMLGNSERYVNLPKPLPIHIEYFTAGVEDGQLKLREDIYDYTRRVAAALAQEG